MPQKMFCEGVIKVLQQLNDKWQPVWYLIVISAKPILTHFFSMFPFAPPENIRKPKVF